MHFGDFRTKWGQTYSGVEFPEFKTPVKTASDAIPKVQASSS